MLMKRPTTAAHGATTPAAPTQPLADRWADVLLPEEPTDLVVAYCDLAVPEDDRPDHERECEVCSRELLLSELLLSELY